MTPTQYRLLMKTALAAIHLLRHAEMEKSAALLREAWDAAVTEWKANEGKAKEEAA